MIDRLAVMNYSSFADLNSENSVGNMVDEQKPVLIVALCSVRQKSHLPNSALLTSDRATFKAGFFFSAVLQTILSTKASGVELKASEYMPAQAGGAAKVAKPSRTRELKGSCVAYGSRNRDVAATYLADLAKKWHIGLGCGIWLQIRDEP